MYFFYLDKCLLPVTPSKLTTKIGNANKTITLINEGQVNLLKTAELTDIDFECEIPQVNHPYAIYKTGFLGASFFLGYFERLKTSKQPFQFMENYTITESASNGFDLTVKISLKQYRYYGTNTVQVKNNIGAAIVASLIVNRLDEHSPAPKRSQKYKVKKGDTLYTIAKRFYGDGSKYKKIQNANSFITDPNALRVGQELTIPAA